MLVDGRWSTEWYTPDEKGRFVRSEPRFHDRVSADGRTGFKAEKGRYHLYVSKACPWAHRTLIMRRLKALEDVITLSIVDWFMGDDGWAFSDRPGCIPDTLNGCKYLRDVYLLADPHFTGRVTVPVLWDRSSGTILNNQSSEIMRMLDVEFDGFGDPGVTYYPRALSEKVDETIRAIYNPINNGVYRAGFATTQGAYDEAVGELFSALDYWEEVLSGRRYLCGDRITEADWCMFTTLVRFDLVYYTHFKCNLRHIYEYPNLWGYLKELYQVPGVSSTCDFHHIKNHYYMSHPGVNPNRIVPAGPAWPAGPLIDLGAPHGRDGVGDKP